MELFIGKKIRYSEDAEGGRKSLRLFQLVSSSDPKGWIEKCVYMDRCMGGFFCLSIRKTVTLRTLKADVRVCLIFKEVDWCMSGWVDRIHFFDVFLGDKISFEEK